MVVAARRGHPPVRGDRVADLTSAGVASKEQQMKDPLKLMVGGAPVTAAFAEEIGADGCGADAGISVKFAKELMD
jgi:hypothetical protein